MNEFDVVVCGYGGSGAAAAIEAHDSGASVLVLERMEDGGGSTAESGGSIITIADPKGAVEHYLSLTEGRTPREVIEAHVAGALELPQWIAACGGDAVEYVVRQVPFPIRYVGSAYPNHPYAEALGARLRLRSADVDHGGSNLWSMLRRNVTERGIQVRFGTRARRLLRRADREICGVVVESDSGEETILARRGVILSCGGFAYRPEFQREYFGTALFACGPPGRNTGDGIDMAIGVGASLWHMTAFAGAFGFKVPNSEAAWLAVLPDHRFYIVDQEGRRYMNEARAEQHASGFAMLSRDLETGEFLRRPSYLVFDESLLQAGPIASSEGGFNRKLHWSDDNNDEVNAGWIRRAATIESLGHALELSASAVRNLVDTNEQYNKVADNGGDQFGRNAAEMARLKAPYFGIPIYPVLLNTQGGPKRDHLARVIHVDGSPILRLFSAGELGSIWASLYPGAGNVTEALVFGRLAGRQAAAMKPIVDFAELDSGSPVG